MMQRILILGFLAWTAIVSAQVSTGVDGALATTTNAVVIFDPVAAGLDLDADNVFHFTTITISAGSTLKLKASKLRKNRAVIFLASGPVTINGTIDLSGEDGVPVSTPIQLTRRPSEPGPGGFAGGLGSRSDTNPNTNASDGYGPAVSRGLAGSATGGCGNGFNASSAHMNISMFPLVGGAGGGGAGCGGNGGAGAGAIRIVSAVSIQIDSQAQILANGGQGTAAGGNWPGGAGGGGMIHLIAPAVTFSAGYNITAFSAAARNPSGPLSSGAGVLRVNANTITGPLNFFNPAPPITGPFYTLPLPSGLPDLTITQVNGVNVANPPSGQLTGLDVVVNAPGASTVTIATNNIPIGTAVNLRISSEIVTDQSITCSPLVAVQGQAGAGTATCSATFPLGANITIASASW